MATTHVCDECLTAVNDEAIGEPLTGEEQATIAQGLGDNIADHRCEQFDGGDRCDCACYGGPAVKKDQTTDAADPTASQWTPDRLRIEEANRARWAGRKEASARRDPND